jgi:hypothetical protein
MAWAAALRPVRGTAAPATAILLRLRTACVRAAAHRPIHYFEKLSREPEKAEAFQAEAIRGGCLNFARHFSRKLYKSLILKYYLLTIRFFCVTDQRIKIVDRGRFEDDSRNRGRPNSKEGQKAHDDQYTRNARHPATPP